MNIERIRAKVKAGEFNIIDHALIEAFKDGISIKSFTVLTMAKLLNNIIISNDASSSIWIGF